MVAVNTSTMAEMVAGAVASPIAMAGQIAAAASPAPAMGGIAVVMPGSAWETNKAEEEDKNDGNKNLGGGATVHVGSVAKDLDGSHSVPTFIKP